MKVRIEHNEIKMTLSFSRVPQQNSDYIAFIENRAIWENGGNPGVILTPQDFAQEIETRTTLQNNLKK